MASYIDSNLAKGEEVIARASISWARYMPVMIILGIPLLFLWGLGLIIIIPCIISVLSTELALTNKRVIAKFGFISRETVELRLEKIESLNVKQDLWGRICNYGSIAICGTGGTTTPIPNIKNPLGFRKVVNDYLEEFENNKAQNNS